MSAVTRRERSWAQRNDSAHRLPPSSKLFMCLVSLLDWFTPNIKPHIATHLHPLCASPCEFGVNTHTWPSVTSSVFPPAGRCCWWIQTRCRRIFCQWPNSSLTSATLRATPTSRWSNMPSSPRWAPSTLSPVSTEPCRYVLQPVTHTSCGFWSLIIKRI